MEQNEIIQVSKKYPQAFKSMDTNLIDNFFTKGATKTGFMYDYEANNWSNLSTVGILELKEWVADYNKKDIMPDSEIKVELLDVQDKIAVAKIELEWAPNYIGCDYLFLVKEEQNWLIEKILWQSII